MKLKDRLDQGASRQSTRPVADSQGAPMYQEIKAQVHQQLINNLELSKLETLPSDELRAELRSTIEALARSSAFPLNRIERERLVQEVLDEITGLGPLETLLADPTISDILVNNFETVYIEREGKLSKVPVRFRDDAHLMQIIQRIVSRVGRRIDETSPMVDARLQDGSRVNAIIPPLALDGPALSIRRFGVRPLGAADLVANGAMTQQMLDFMAAAVRAKLNILISGGTGSGKTTLLNALSSFIPHGERVVTIEDAAELQLQQPHVVRLETRPPNVEGKGAVRARELVVNSLRMRPDRIIVGEVRAEEVLDMLQAMNTGHEGSMTTVHANTTRDALTRLVNMAGLNTANFSTNLMNQTVSRALDLIIQLNRFPDGSRKVVAIAEITGMEGEVIAMQDIYEFRRRGISPDGKVLGEHRPTGIRPRAMERIERSGYGRGTEFTT
ncbi:MAG: CpaF family protein [Myxococcales bacterium]|jgi:pilus assembly protein CpaF